MSKKVNVQGMAPKEIMVKYHVSRATAYRGAKIGYIVLGYHIPEIMVDMDRARKNLDLIIMIAEQTLYRQFGWIANKADARSEAILKLLLLSGHPNFGSKNWMIRVAVNALRDFAKRERRFAKIASDVDRVIDWDALYKVENIELFN